MTRSWLIGNRSVVVLQATHLLKKNSDHLRALNLRAAANSSLGDFSAAADDLRKVLQLSPNEPRQWFRSTLLHLRAGRMAEFQRQSHLMVEKFAGDQRNSVLKQVAKVCLLEPRSWGEEHKGVQIARQIFSDAEKGDGMNDSRFVNALADLRTGNIAAASQAFDQLRENRSENPALELAAHFYLSLCDALQGHAEQALQRWDTAQQHYSIAQRTIGNNQWVDWLICDLARLEAKSKIVRAKKVN